MLSHFENPALTYCTIIIIIITVRFITFILKITRGTVFESPFGRYRLVNANYRSCSFVKLTSSPGLRKL